MIRSFSKYLPFDDLVGAFVVGSVGGIGTGALVGDLVMSRVGDEVVGAVGLPLSRIVTSAQFQNLHPHGRRKNWER
jgi:hypothetical protein